jgi:iron complex transport system permease protein
MAKGTRKIATSLLALSLLALGALAVSVIAGSVRLGPAEILAGLLDPDSGLARTLIMELRLPRALAAFAVGGLLAVAGSLMQVLLRNPLADPYILGVSGGAAVCALFAMMTGLGGLWIDGGAFAGALGATLLVFALASGGPGGWSPVRLLLTGVVLAAGFAAVISLMLALGPDSSLRGMLFWLMGDLSFAGAPGLRIALLAVAVCGGIVLGRHLNILARGDIQAQILGVEVRPLRVAIYLVSSLLTAVAVTTAGSIGFVGLVVPHLMRSIIGSDHRVLIPAAALGGGTLLVLADTLARSLVAPRQLPVGALTALVGVPLFLVLIRRNRPAA